MANRRSPHGGHPGDVGYDRGSTRDLPIDEPTCAADTDELMPHRLLVDEGAWDRAGEELRAVDPQRYIAILQVVQDIVSIHKNPIGKAAASGYFLFSQKKDDSDLS